MSAAITPVTLGSLITSVRQEAEMVGDQFVTDLEVTSYLNSELAELYGLMLQAYGTDYFVSSQMVAVVANTDTYALAADFLKLIHVRQALGGVPTQYLRCRRMNRAEADSYSGLASVWGAVPGFRGAGPAYYLEGNTIVFVPMPSASATIQIKYTPRAQVLSDPLLDTWDGYNGWEEYAIVGAAIRCKDKEEDDVSVLMARKQSLKERIESEASARNDSEPARIVDDADSSMGGW